MADAIGTLLSRARRARFENPSDARRDLVEAVALARTAKDPMQLAQALTALGQIERDLHHSDEALHHYEEAAAIYRLADHRLADHRTADVPLKLAHTIRHVGDIHRHEGRTEPAESCYQEALAIYRAHPEMPPLDLANALRGFALLKETAADPQTAKSLWEEAGKLYASVNVEAGVAESKRRLALLKAQSD
ncbi:MAG TPA: tetratricopeptide repeat protein [Candidatus Angelobacter sp.]|nr:tetratricopeptide repeat protein [Candidatus Angelobacter sp.]